MESSDPARRTRPDLDRATHVRLSTISKFKGQFGQDRGLRIAQGSDFHLELAVGGRKTLTCWSERMSNRRDVLSSDPETKHLPLGWNCN